MDYAMRQEGLPSHSLWDCPMGESHTRYVHEDNRAMLAVMRSGRNPTMRYLHRTHRVSVQWLHEHIYTKTFDAVNKLSLIHISEPTRLALI
eukprot:11277818-Alexandrium_andersonii.AAC.1